MYKKVFVINHSFNFRCQVLREKLCKFKPKVAVFNGKAIYEVYSGQKKFMFGRQPTPLSDGATWLWVMPSSSARCAQLPRAVDKVPFFEALRKFRDYQVDCTKSRIARSFSPMYLCEIGRLIMPPSKVTVRSTRSTPISSLLPTVCPPMCQNR